MHRRLRRQTLLLFDLTPDTFHTQLTAPSDIPAGGTHKQLDLTRINHILHLPFVVGKLGDVDLKQHPATLPRRQRKTLKPQQLPARSGYFGNGVKTVKLFFSLL